MVTNAQVLANLRAGKITPIEEEKIARWYDIDTDNKKPREIRKALFDHLQGLDPEGTVPWVQVDPEPDPDPMPVPDVIQEPVGSDRSPVIGYRPVTQVVPDPVPAAASPNREEPLQGVIIDEAEAEAEAPAPATIAFDSNKWPFFWVPLGLKVLATLLLILPLGINPNVVGWTLIVMLTVAVVVQVYPFRQSILDKMRNMQ